MIKIHHTNCVHMSTFLILALVAFLQIAHAINVDESDYKYVRAVNMTSTNSYAQAINYGQTHPTRDGGSWSGW